MVEKLIPEINKVYFINQHTLIHILSGTGSIQVDFKNYTDWQDKAIYLEKGQYIKFMSDDFIVRKIQFPNEAVYHNKEVRVLFKHLISLGYIDFSTCEECHLFLTNTIFSNNLKSIIDVSSKQWYWQNPFQATKEEYQIIFDVKDVIDAEYNNGLTNKDIVSLIDESDLNPQALVKDKIGLSVKKLLNQKRLIESQKEIAFTDKSIKEIAYEHGFHDPAYFNRVFKTATGSNPKDYRNTFDYANRDQFSQDIFALLKEFHTEEKTAEFYADKFNISVKTLSRKVRQKMNTSLGELLRVEILNTAKSMLIADESITNIASHLKFEEPNHFSAYFKRYTGITPTAFKSKKYNS